MKVSLEMEQKRAKATSLKTRLKTRQRRIKWTGLVLLSHFLSFTHLSLFTSVDSRFDCGMGEGVVRSERPVHLNSWNRVTVYRDGWAAWLTLNGGQQVSGQSQGLFTDINFQLELFLGGSPNLTLVSQRTNSFTGLTGCVRKLEINWKSIDFRSDNRGDALDGIDIGQLFR